jgi:hypothetical protein
MVNHVTGEFTWQPTGAQIGACTLTVRVTDNGSPALSHEVAFGMEVIPANSAPTAVAVRLWWCLVKEVQVLFRHTFSGLKWKVTAFSREEVGSNRK